MALAVAWGAVPVAAGTLGTARLAKNVRRRVVLSDWRRDRLPASGPHGTPRQRRIALDTLTQFVYRLAWGLAGAMAVTSPRWVTSGYFRVHLYVVLGLATLALAVAWQDPTRFEWFPAVGVMLLSYVGSVCWLYERPRLGKIALWLVAGLAVWGAWLSAPPCHSSGMAFWLRSLDPIAGGLVLGSTMAAMLLGHWYLNTPTMRLDPLRRLIALMAVAVALRAVLCGCGLVLEWSTTGVPATDRVLFVALRWLAGVLGTWGVAWMAWQTLKIPNTQSATGLLYVAVITTFLGELTSQLLSADTLYPL